MIRFPVLLGKINVRNGMVVVKIHQAHRHRPIVQPAIRFAIIVATVVAPAPLHVKAQILGKPALVSDLHRLIHASVALVLEIGHFQDMRTRKSRSAQQHHQ